jgi:hypothetical protein
VKYRWKALVCLRGTEHQIPNLAIDDTPLHLAGDRVGLLHAEMLFCLRQTLEVSWHHCSFHAVWGQGSYQL